MHKKNDTTPTIGKTGAAIKAQQLSTTTKETLTRRPINMNIVSNTRLIWFDQNIDTNCTDYCDDMQKLQNIVSTIDSFADVDQCIDFLTDITNEKVHMVISDATDVTLISLIHNIQQLQTIFIYDKQQLEQEQSNLSGFKVKGVFTEISSICEVLKTAVQECEHNAMSISIMDIGDRSKKNLDRLDPSFMYLKIMKEILLDIDFESQHFKQYIEYCRTAFAENDRELQKIKNFEEKYREKTPIWWYTLQSFLYPMVNRGLRIIDVDIIIKMGFFIKDLHRHIEQIHNEQFKDVHSQEKFVVYRGQGMAKTDVEHLTKSKGGLLSFNNFLSTSKDRSVSLRFANRALANLDLIGVLFIMSIDPSQSTTPFASIKNVSAIPGEDEVLFAMQTVFRIGTITSIGENLRLFQVELTLVSDNDKDLRQLTDHIRKETYPDAEGWFRLGLVLYKMGEFDKSEEVHKTLLEQTTTDSEKANIYVHLGKAKFEQGEYKEAIALYEKAVKIYKKNLPSQRNNLASAYNNIGLVYNNMGAYSKALSYYEKAPEIQHQSLPPNHPSLVSSYNNIGIVYKNMGEHSKALSYYEKSLEIQQQSLPPNHPDLASSYNNIGLVYSNMGKYSKALSYYEKSLEIKQQSLPPNHPDLPMSYNNIGMVYDKMGGYSKALSYYEKALEIQQQSLPPNHPSLAMSYNNIGIVYKNMGEYSKALSYYEKSLEIKQQSLPPNHPNLAASYGNIGLLYEEMDNYSKAHSSFQRALQIVQQSLPTTHPVFRQHQNNFDRIKRKL